MNKKYLLLIPVVIIVVVLLIVFRKSKSATVTPQHKSITEAIYASGYIMPKNEYKVFSLSDGYITAKYKEGGDEVKQGEEIYRVQNDAAAAKLSASASALEIAKINVGENSPVLLDLKNKIKNAEAKFANDSLHFVRYKNMFKAQAITQTQFDQALLAYEIARNEVKSANETYKRAKDQMQIELKNAQSASAASTLDFGNYTIRSIISGMVYDTYKDIGEAVRRTELVAIVGEKGNKIIDLSVDQQDIDKVKIGQEVIVKTDVTGSKIYKAKVSKIYPAMNQQDQSFKIEAAFTENYEINFVHTSVEANIIIAQKDSALVIPKNLIQPGDIVEVKSMGINKTVKIKRGLENFEFVEVVEGITGADEIVVPSIK